MRRRLSPMVRRRRAPGISIGSEGNSGPFTPAPATARTTLGLTAAATGTKPWTVGHVFKQGDLPSGAALSGIQTTVKSTWPDGSAKIAVLAGITAFASTSATLQIGAGSQPSGAPLSTTSLKATGITAVVDAGAFGSASWAGTDWDAPFQTWVSGPVMSSWVYRKPIGSDAHLVAWVEVRLFSTGAVEVLPWVENGYLNVAGPTNKSATYSFALGGTQRFSAAIDLPNHCRTPLLSGSALAHWLGADPGIQCRHDAAYLMATEQVPAYWATVPNNSALVTALPATFAPLQQGAFSSGMGNAGYGGHIGLLPEWDVLYLTSTAPTVWAAIQRQGYSAGRYGIHHRDETTNRPPRFSSYPNTVLGGGMNIDSTGSSATNTFTPSATGTAPAAWFTSHHPSVGFMAYLVSGRFYHMETVQFAATANYLKSSSTPRQGALGVIQTWSANLTRGAAWSVRTLAQAVAATPDSDTALRGEFVASMEANINAQHTTYATNAQGPLGFMQPFTNYAQSIVDTTGAGSTSTSIHMPNGTGATDGEYVQTFANGGGWTITIGGETRPVVGYVGATHTATVSPAFTVATASQPYTLSSGHWFEAGWMQDFYTAAVGYAKAMDPPLGATAKTKLTEFFAWKAKSVVGRFGGIGATEYLYRDAATYTICIAESESWTAQHTDWGKVWTDTAQSHPNGPKVIGDGSLRGTIDMTAYWGNLQPALAYAVRHGVTGASAARSLMMGAPNWGTLDTGADAAPVWAVAPLVDPVANTTLATAAASMSAGQWLRINAADIASPGAFFKDNVSGSTFLYDFCHKGGYDPIRKQFRWLGMGHGGSMRWITFDEGTNAWSVSGPPSWYVEGDLGHGYSHNCIDPTTGDDYHRRYNDAGGVNRFNRATGAWVKTAAEPAAPTITGGLDFLPTIGTQGGLVWTIGNVVRRWDKAADTWSLAGSIIDLGTAAMSAYSSVENVVFSGAGGIQGTKWYRTAATGVPVALPDCPISANDTVSMCWVCPVSGHLLVVNSSTSAYRWNGTNWAPVTFSGAPAFTCTTGDGSLSAVLAPYGVTMIQLGNVGQVWLYKHA